MLGLRPADLWSALNDRRFPECDILFMDIARGLTTDVIADQLTDGRGKIEIYRVYVFCHEAILQGPERCFPNAAGFGMEAEMVEQHGCGQDAAEGIGDVFSGGLRIGTMDGFEERGAFADGGGRQQAEGAADDAGFVA